MQTEFAYAKINLCLDVESRRANGYHNIVSIMQTVTLHDEVQVDFTPAEHTEITLHADGNDQMPLDQSNLAYRAASLFLNHTQIFGQVSIHLHKQIPMAAGLAGGSADAAAVLRALNTLCGHPLSIEALCALGSKLGADIPFCIVGGSAFVTGIGEVLEESPALPPCYLVVACGGEGVSTVWAYRQLDERYQQFSGAPRRDPRPAQILACLEKQKLEEACAHFYNLFEEVVCEYNSCIGRIKGVLQREGAITALMSGSGPSVFGVFLHREEAEFACDCLNGQGIRAFVCQPAEKYPL